MKALNRSRMLVAAIPLFGLALAAIPAAAAPGSHTVHIGANLTVTHTATPGCEARICIIRNHGSGTMTPYGKLTFTTVITADGNQPAGLQCPHPQVGPAVKAAWAADGAASTGIFAGASGHGSDTAYPALNTAGPNGTLTSPSPARCAARGCGEKRVHDTC